MLLFATTMFTLSIIFSSVIVALFLILGLIFFLFKKIIDIVVLNIRNIISSIFCFYKHIFNKETKMINYILSTRVKVQKTLLIAIASMLALFCSCMNIAGAKPVQSKGIASWYGPGFHGKKTASGEKYNMYGFTAAHKTLKFATKVKVTNLKNNKSVIVRINDRGPFIRGRVIDLSKTANKQIGCNLCNVKLEVLKH